ncbi:uncharacterized protein G2W53_042971 [Senna tora]|uniref:Uncharacterized protein n=1 Tax=Senna tora TaxID=362788 RepID=A0A834SG77_9FABA|nr:uncharacterized protein G2W53_042971 [Senna tora]
MGPHERPPLSLFFQLLPQQVCVSFFRSVGRLHL